MKKGKDLFSMEESLNAMLDVSGLKGRKASLLIYRTWPRVVGKKIAENTRIETVNRNTLVVNVSSPVWMQELQFLKKMIVEKLEKELGPGIIRDVRFKTGPVPTSEIRVKDLSRICLDENDRKTAQKASDAIKDPELRKAFQHLMETHLKNKKEE